MNGFDIHGLSDRLDYYAQRCAEFMIAGGGPLPEDVDREGYALRKARAVEMLRAGIYNATEIGKAAGMTTSAVYGVAHREGIVIARQKIRRA